MQLEEYLKKQAGKFKFPGNIARWRTPKPIPKIPTVTQPMPQATQTTQPVPQVTQATQPNQPFQYTRAWDNLFRWGKNPHWYNFFSWGQAGQPSNWHIVNPFAHPVPYVLGGLGWYGYDKINLPSKKEIGNAIANATGANDLINDSLKPYIKPAIGMALGAGSGYLLGNSFNQYGDNPYMPHLGLIGGGISGALAGDYFNAPNKRVFLNQILAEKKKE